MKNVWMSYREEQAMKGEFNFMGWLNKKSRNNRVESATDFTCEIKK